ncbi:helicase DnaB [Bacillus thuringiensis]|uniref:DnaD domain protein n=1 Tax=Bacillus thuringiensis TaxID=1428 RepID=UPI00333B5163
MNKQEALLQLLNTYIPEQVLMDMYDIRNIPNKEMPFFLAKDQHIINTVRDTFKLPDPVINVLIHYVMLSTDMRFPKAYVEKIAGHWVRKKITTAEAALALAKKEHHQYNEWIKGQKEEETDPHEITLIDSIRGAIKAGLTDEQLGRHVRYLLVK